jgi:phosphatidylserine/phosphatidylglycerophosphate/cardiolipin synthase-like enzyme
MMPSSGRATRLPVFTASESDGTRAVRRRRRVVPDAPPAEPRAAANGHAELVANAAHFTRIVRSGICAARTSVDIMTADFKAMLVPDESVISTGRGGRRGRYDARSIVEVFRDLAARGVEIRLLHAGTPSSAALRELKQSLPTNLTIRRCPRLHAKTVIVDARGMYLGSANLTGAGLGAKSDGRRNFELGVWTESPALIDAVLEHFNDLWEGRDCKSCKRKDVCPVPLEEPEL